MKGWKKVTAIAVMLAGALIVSSCGDSSGTQGGTAASGDITEKEYTATGEAGAGFPDAKSNAYAALLEEAIRDMIGDSEFTANETTITSHFLSYQKGYKYVDDPSWANRTTDTDGNMVLTLQAMVDLVKLEEDLGNLGISASTATVATTTSSSTSSSTTTSTSTSTSTSTTTTGDVSLEDADLTSLSFLVFYAEDDIIVKGDRDLEYADWVVSTVNSELTALGLDTYDPDAQELLVEERNLMQEATAGSLGVGLLLAEAVAAELYAEVIPDFTYSGPEAYVMITMKVYSRTTGSLLLETTKGGDEITAANQAGAVKGSMKLAVAKIMEELMPVLADYVNGGRAYFIRLQNVTSYRDASSFSSSVANVSDVVSINLKNYSSDDMVADYTVKYTGNPLDMLDSVMLYLLDKPGFEYFDLVSVRGNELIFTMD